jgi:hypothetical protein
MKQQQQQQTAAESTEPHYTAEQVAEFWNLDPISVRRMFRDEPGVLKFGNAESTYKRTRSAPTRRFASRSQFWIASTGA